MLFDTHCHLNFKAFEGTYKEVIRESVKQGVMINNVGSQYATSVCAVKIAREFEGESIYATVGLHPVHVGRGENEQEYDENEGSVVAECEIVGAGLKPAPTTHEFDYEKYKELARDSKVVAIGECGIDYFRLPQGENERLAVMKKQEDVFKAHIRLAEELKKPLMIHCRPSKENPGDGYKKVIEILREFAVAFLGTPLQGVVHCFIGSKETAREFLNLGFYISFTGIITFKNIGLLEVVREVPIERILIETDAPYLAPEPFRGKTNYPYYVEYVARKIAEIKGMEYEEVAEVTTRNARDLFGA